MFLPCPAFDVSIQLEREMPFWQALLMVCIMVITASSQLSVGISLAARALLLSAVSPDMSMRNNYLTSVKELYKTGFGRCREMQKRVILLGF